MVKKLVSVIVCTYSLTRYHDLSNTVHSVLSQTYPDIEPIVVVDHNEELASLLRQSLNGQVRVIENCGDKGLSGARNSGIAAATGEFLAFIDDDAIADANWIQSLVQYYDHDEIAATGGYIEPAWEGGAKPSWMPAEFNWVVGCSYTGLPTDVAPVRNVIGCNMSFRTSIFDDFEGFSSSIGRLGSKPLGCEETELCIRIRKRWPNHKVLYIPSARVRHYVPKTRQRRSYFLSRCFYEGISKAVVRSLAGASSFDTEARYVRETLPRGLFQRVNLALRPQPSLGALQEASMMVLGLLATTTGFVGASLWQIVQKKRHP